MSESHSDIENETIFFLEEQEVILTNFEADGFILDIGGGGEGVIGQIKKGQVITIDPNRRELEEAADGPLKIVMDANELQFLDDTFQTVTSFFTLMYIKATQHEKVFQEIFRVLDSGGRFLIWDMEIPQCLDESKEVVAAYLKVKLPDREIQTGYGTRWPENPKDLTHYLKVAEKVGFEVTRQEVSSRVIQLELKKL